MNKLREVKSEVDKSHENLQGVDRVFSSTTGARNSLFSGSHPLIYSGASDSLKDS